MNKTKLIKFLNENLMIRKDITRRGMGVYKNIKNEIVVFFGEYSERLLPWQIDILKLNNIDILKIYGVK